MCKPLFSDKFAFFKGQMEGRGYRARPGPDGQFFKEICPYILANHCVRYKIELCFINFPFK
jgi:hypothetical protein